MSEEKYKLQGIEWVIWAYVFWPIWIIPAIAAIEWLRHR